ncbi:hypothetical protein [Microcystis phage Mel-JY01]
MQSMNNILANNVHRQISYWIGDMFPNSVQRNIRMNNNYGVSMLLPQNRLNATNCQIMNCTETGLFRVTVSEFRRNDGGQSESTLLFERRDVEDCEVESVLIEVQQLLKINS